MLARILLLLTLIPLIDLVVLILIGQAIGFWPTIGLVVAAGVLGVLVARLRGLRAWRSLQTDLATGQMPGDALFDGLAMLLAAVLLITPGVLTDLAALVLLFPPTRRPLRGMLRGRITRMIAGPGISILPLGGFGPGMDAAARGGFGGGFGNVGAPPQGGHRSGGARYYDAAADGGGTVIDITPDEKPTPRGEFPEADS